MYTTAHRLGDMRRLIRQYGRGIETAASLATVDGLEGLPVGNLAAAIGMSTNGQRAHFGSEQELQLAGRTFTECE